MIGGGTGTTVVLEGLKKYKDLNLSVIVGMMDDGGSNASVRDEFGLLPLSDVRKSLIAFYDSGNNEVLRKLFLYRFSVGEGIKGHTLGNLLMIAMTEILGSEIEAIEMFKNMFGIKGNIIPVTLDKVKLVAEYENGSVIVGEHHIDEPEEDENIKKIYLQPSAKATPEALEAIRKADYIVLGPGDIYTTTLSNIVVDGIKNAIKESRAKTIYITNLMSKKGQTRRLTQSQCLKIMEDGIGRKMDIVLINNGKLPKSAYERYKADGEDIIEDDIQSNGKKRLVIRKNLVADGEIRREKGDQLVRSLVRHDSVKLATELYRIFNMDRNGILSIVKRLFSYYKD